MSITRAAVRNGDSNDSHEGPDHAAFERLTTQILFAIMLIFLVGTFFMTKKKLVPLPHTVVLFVCGIVFGAVALWVAPDVANALGEVPPELLFYVFLPVLIFEGSYAMNIHALRQIASQAAILAIVGVIINTGLLAIAIKLFFSSWSWYTTLLLGSLLSATDPVAVVALLKDLGVEKSISAMVDGESVMNDGTAIIAFTLLLPAARAGALVDSAWVIILKCIQLSVLPIIIGPLFGFVQSFWIRRTHDELTKACVTISVTYVSYFVAAYGIGTSGVLTLFFQGVFLSYSNPSLFPGRDGNLIYTTWEFLVHLGNTILFALVGVILVADVIPTIHVVDALIIVCLYLAMVVSRLIMFEVLLPLLNLFPYKISQRCVFLMTHSGLRGGVAVTLALAVKQENIKEGVPMLKVTCGVVMLTLLVNASTAEKVVALLGFKQCPQYQLVQTKYALNHLVIAGDRVLQTLKRDTKYRNTSWLAVDSFVAKEIKNPLAGVKVQREAEDVVLNRLCMSAFKSVLWRQRDEKIISETVVLALSTTIADVIAKGELLDVQQLHFHHMNQPGGASCGGGDGARPPHSCPTPRRRRQQPVVVPLQAESPPSAQPHNDPFYAAQPPGREPSVLADLTPAEEELGDSTEVVADALMDRLLPTWVKLVERLCCGKVKLASAHRRAQENAFMTLLAIVKCLTALSPIKYQYIHSEAQAQRVERWLSRQLLETNAAIRFFYQHFPEVTNNVSSTRAALSVVRNLQEAVESLQEFHGFGVKAAEVLTDMLEELRQNIPTRWDTDAVTRESDLVLRAVAATVLGRGLRRTEIAAIGVMGLTRRFHEGDVITLPENAFLIVVFGSLRAISGRWTTINQDDLMENFGDTVGLESLLLPAELRQDQQRQWRVVTSEATALLISFNSIKPFLMERSLRAVKALWRAAAVEVLLPFLVNMITVPAPAEVNEREMLISLIMEGTPLIGPQDCQQLDWTSRFCLCFYLRGSDASGLFSGPTPPAYVSILYARQLVWTDPNVVLYAIPVNVSSCGYVPWQTSQPPATAVDITSTDTNTVLQTAASAAPVSPTLVISRAEELGGGPLNYQPAEELLPFMLPSEAGIAASANSRSCTPPPRPDASRSASAHVSVGPVDDGDEDVGGHPQPGAFDTLTSILGRLLRGELPERLLNEFDRAPGGDTDVESTENMHSPLTMQPSPTASSFLNYDGDLVCILQRVSLFVTPVPYANQLLVQYAAVLEQLCIAALRYVQDPHGDLNVLHAHHSAEEALKFLLSFSVELTLIRRAITILAEQHPEATTLASQLQPLRQGDWRDAAFHSKVCMWSREASYRRKYHLRTMVIEMTAFANCRFALFTRALREAAVLEPALATVESVEGLQGLVSPGSPVRAGPSLEDAPH